MVLKDYLPKQPLLFSIPFLVNSYKPSAYASQAIINQVHMLLISTGERPIVDILQDRRYWVIHIITIPALFLSGVVCVASGISFNIAGTPNWLGYLSSTTSLSLLNDRFSLGIFV